MTTQDLITQLNALADLQAKATPGPWEISHQTINGMAMFCGPLCGYDGDALDLPPESPTLQFVVATRAFPFAELAEALENTRYSIQEWEIKYSGLKQHLIDMSRAISRFIHREGSEEELEQAIDDLGEDTYLIDDAKECERLRLLITKEREERDQLRDELENVRNQWHIDLNDKVQLRAENDQLASQLQVEFSRGNEFVEETLQLRSELATRTDGILPCPKCGSVPIYWYTETRERNHWGCKKGCVYGPENDPFGAKWNAMVRGRKESGE